ncbi:Armadillo Repeat-Containing Protein 8 [Manis pentadactyla]|nr:Armadillo Repeat-Containing Protein 8 [Manis pentadactyla]
MFKVEERKQCGKTGMVNNYTIIIKFIAYWAHRCRQVSFDFSASFGDSDAGIKKPPELSGKASSPALETIILVITVTTNHRVPPARQALRCKNLDVSAAILIMTSPFHRWVGALDVNSDSGPLGTCVGL